MTMRLARPDEAAALTELVLRSKAYRGYSTEFLERCREELAIHSEDVIRQRTTVAEVDGRVVAVATLTGEPPQGELGMLFVEPDLIGKGVGGRLFRHIAETARDSGFQSLILDADPHAEPFYTAMGAVHTGVVPSGSIPGRTLNRFTYGL